MIRILFIKKSNQLEIVRRERPELLRSAELVALSLRAWLDLRGEGFHLRAASDFLSAGELREIPIRARKLSRLWFEPFSEMLDYEGMNLGELVRIENAVFFRELIAADLIAQRLTKKLDPREVFIFSEQQIACFESNRTNSKHDVCEATLVDSFARNGVTVSNLARIQRGRFSFIPLKIKQRALKIARSLKDPRLLFSSPAENGQKRNRALPARRDREKLLLAIGEGVDLLSLAPLAALIDSTGDYSAALVNTDSNICSSNARSGLGAISDENVFPLVEAYSAKAPDSGRKLIEQARRAFDSARRARIYGSDSPLNNPLLDVHFNALWKMLLVSTIPHIDRVSAFLNEVKPDGVIVAGVEQAKDRATVKIANNLGIRTLAIPHGYIGNLDAYEFETDMFLAWGEASRRCLIDEFDKPPHSIKVFGPIPLNRLRREKNESGSRHRLLVVTSRAAPVCCDAVDAQAFESAWEVLVSFVERSPDVELIIKPHPGGSDLVEWYEGICARLNGRARVEPSRRLEEMADEIDAVVAMIDTSTAILVSQLLSLPAIFIRAVWREMTWAARAWGGEYGLESIDSIEEIAPALKRLLFDEAFRNRCLERGRRLLERNLKTSGPQEAKKELEAIVDECFVSSPSEQPAIV